MKGRRKMKVILRRHQRAACVWIFLFFLFLSNTPPLLQAQTTATGEEVRVERISVVPLLKGRVGSKTSETLNATLNELFFNPENITPDADITLTRLVHNALNKRYGDRTVPLSNVLAFEESTVKDGGLDTPRTLAQRTGAALGANVVMGGYVWRYRDRKGGAYAAETTASVGFVLYLIDVSSGKMLWQGAFEETQRSLSENILDAKKFFERGGKWLTADELAHFGIQHIFKKYPY
jgi:hypothetical protein